MRTNLTKLEINHLLLQPCLRDCHIKFDIFYVIGIHCLILFIIIKKMDSAKC